jgi:DNA-binding CsgD family transcriptional regulator
MELFEYVERFNCTKSLSDLFGCLVAAADRQGYGQVAYGPLTYNEPLHLPDHVSPFVAMNFPRDWRDRYVARKYYAIDPVVVFTPCLTRPFLWSWLQQRPHLEPSQRMILEEAREAGLKNGVSVPLHGPWGRVAVLSFASRDEDCEPMARLSHLNALAALFQAAFSDLSRRVDRAPDAPIQLSPREKDCLTWTALGKSSWDIGTIMRISEHTVNFHIKNAMRKLGTTSRMEAAIKSIRLNLICLQSV